jgi:disulfide oxidoreductase YuzD
MSEPISIQIVGAPVACAEGLKDTWRDLAGWIGGKLRARYGTAVTITYFDLFDPNCPPLPPDTQLPLVLIDGQVFSSGGKLSMPAIRRHLDALGV